jgi:ABC-type uncharacterized transport system involved in gliding motility auxiliary subunit
MKKIVENFSFKRYLLLAIVFFIVSLIISLIIDGTKSINIINTLIFSFIMSLFARFNKKIKTQSNQSDEKL